VGDGEANHGTTSVACNTALRSVDLSGNNVTSHGARALISIVLLGNGGVTNLRLLPNSAIDDTEVRSELFRLRTHTSSHDGGRPRQTPHKPRVRGDGNLVPFVWPEHAGAPRQWLDDAHGPSAMDCELPEGGVAWNTLPLDVVRFDRALQWQQDRNRDRSRVFLTPRSMWVRREQLAVRLCGCRPAQLHAFARAAEQAHRELQRLVDAQNRE
jgi:hypothetical protein